MRLYTIGFTQKRAETFFDLLAGSGVRTLIDIRLNPGGQLSGFAKQDDLPYFLKHLANGCDYVHLPQLAPTKDVLTSYRSNSDWPRYVERFEALMDDRGIPNGLNPPTFADGCLLCSEATPEQCHRRLVAERLARAWDGVEIVHL